MTVEFVNAISTRPAKKSNISETFRAGIDPAWLKRYARTIDEFGFDYTLVPYHSSGPDQYALAATILAATERLKTVVAVRPNTSFPTVAAQALATLDQLSEGRTIVHIISGSDDAEQQRQGDYLSKTQRYERSTEFIQILRDVWTKKETFSHHGKYYDFDNFGPAFETFSGQSLPVSLGGSSDFAYASGGQQADIFALWGEPLKETKQQIDRVYDEAHKAGRTERIRFWVTFRPVVAETDELAEQKARGIVEAAAKVYGNFGQGATNVGTVRLQEIAKAAEYHEDGVLWTPRAFAGAGGASSLLVGSPETIAKTLVKYVELGADIISLPSLGDIGESIDTGRYIIPLVHEEVARRGIDLDAAWEPAALAS
ncbi:MAG: Flavin-dependent oxidoreductase, F420-dependent methylene-tetrahydromethanopterin reductase [Subtercola sp.]|nr:Flavin-dependent oxidoreductase, F420-dependent methylene-tetrahydromethanopterin reductase [Subtercola sp.]